LWLSERLAGCGLALQCPDLNEPDFSTLTVTRMIDRVEAEMRRLQPGPVCLIGSSLGAFVAVQVAGRCAAGTPWPVRHLVLLAPAFDFPEECERILGPEAFARWRTTGRVEAFHYAYGERRTLRYRLYEDARRYDPFAAALRIPVLIIQGRFDRSVDVRAVERFAREQSDVTLQMVDDDHQLLRSLDVIWRGVSEALRLTGHEDRRGGSRPPAAGSRAGHDRPEGDC
jgi:pimeloyl-ACP methyl ester carboxylesterase